ncbi:MAG: glutamine--fructose-6-phosphate transaminase (isomerizing) [Bacillota bacterium]
MCGIVGYVGEKQALSLLLDSLEKLEYRGYDSAGVALIGADGIKVRKTSGYLSALRELTKDAEDLQGTVGMGHTRWATHGEPTDVNSHPHLSSSGRVAVVHNGIIENYAELRTFLMGRGYTFQSETDTEIVAQLIDSCYRGDPLAAVQEAVSELEGSFALGILFEDYPWQMIAVRKDSPLIVGLGEGENFIASDIPALIKHTRNILRLGEREVAVIGRDCVTVFDSRGERVSHEPQRVEWDIDSAERGGYEHFMLKEIMEQGTAISKTIKSRLVGDEIALELKNITPEVLRKIDKVYIVACGSAFHAGVIGKLLIQQMTGLNVTADLASEFRYSYPSLDENTLCIIISQSGETIDTLFALREAKRLGAHTISIVNVVGSAIANESEDVLYTHAGPEIAVATTKAYNTQLAVLYLLAMHMASVRGMLDPNERKRLVASLRALPVQVDALLTNRAQVQHLASLYFNHRDIFFIGRNLDYALALEGSLKLKEISYIHSEAYAAGELKHGTISLIEKGTLVIALCTGSRLLEKMVSNIREVRARGAQVISIAQEGAPLVEEASDHVIWLPKSDAFTVPSLSVIPLQLFAYFVAALKGCNIDKPRNLAKSVTVE